MMYKEMINLKAAHYLYNQDDHWFASFYENKKIREMKDETKKVKKFLASMIMFNGTMTRKYDFARSMNYGRMYCGNSIQGIHKDFRGVLCSGITTDIDMVNAHPTILLYVCKKHNIMCPNLEAYVMNREHYLDEFVEHDPTMTRAAAKEMFLIATNDNKKNYKIKYYFFKHYDSELKRIQAELLGHEDYADIVDHAKKSNLLGSNLNHILCKYENEFLMTLVRYLEQKHIAIHSLMFDGLMVYGDYYEDDRLLHELEEVVNNEWNCNIRLSYKHHSQKIEIPDDFTFKTLQTYQAMKEEFEQTHLKVGNLYIKECSDHVNIMKRTEMLDTYEHLKCMCDGKKEHFIMEWVKDETIRVMETMDMYPKQSLCPPNTYNLWKPFRCEMMKEDYEKDEEGLQFCLNHIDMLCGRNKACFEFVKLWIAQMIQHPEIKSCMLIFISKQGIGKGLFIEMLRQMLGTKRVVESTNPGRDVWGQFNTLMKDAFLVNINEAGRKDTFDMEGTLLGLITDSTIWINDKGKSAFEQKSFHRYIWTTNKDDPVPTCDDDRRNVIMRCSDEMKGNHVYFKKLLCYISNESTIRTMYDYFKNMSDVPEKIPEHMMPVTEYHKQMKEMQRDPILLFLEDFAMRYEGVQKITTTHIFELYREFCSKNNFRCDYMTSPNFGMKLTRMNISGVSKGTCWRENGQVLNGRGYNVQEMRKHLKINVEEDVDDQISVQEDVKDVDDDGSASSASNDELELIACKLEGEPFTYFYNELDNKVYEDKHGKRLVGRLVNDRLIRCK